jgi:hypothetical protein
MIEREEALGELTKFAGHLAFGSRVPLALCGLQVWSPRTETPVVLLLDPADPFAPQTYRFPGQTSGGFDKSEVIVQFGKLTRGRCVEGFLRGHTLIASRGAFAMAPKFRGSP